jgi:CheY-like chemotaxis protein
VRVATGVRELERVDAERFGRLTGATPVPGSYVALEVTDTGKGMDAATQARIFEPFFTTKATGHGLGLAAVLGIVRGHGGGIQLESLPGRGTSLVVLFPVHGGPGAEGGPHGELPSALPVLDTAVLVVDDEAMVREVVQRFLENGGYRVLTAHDGSEAVRVFQQHSGEIGVVLLDLSMPGPSPAETLRALRALEPNVRVVLTSGYADAESRRSLHDVSGFIAKPARASQYLDAVRKCLEGCGERVDAEA